MKSITKIAPAAKTEEPAAKEQPKPAIVEALAGLDIGGSAPAPVQTGAPTIVTAPKPAENNNNLIDI